MIVIALENDWLAFFGRFHPLFVHLPIGIVVLGFILELIDRKNKKRQFEKVNRLILGIGALSAILASATGYFLSQEGGYGQASIDIHQWAGIGFSIVLLLTWILSKTRAYFTLYILTVIGVFVTGHLGGNLTHGDTYLTEYLPENVKGTFGLKSEKYVVENVTYEEANLYQHVVYPMLHEKCISCHNDSKMKGELNMKDFAAFMKGGENGEVVAFGDIEGSDMVKRMLLSEDHEDTMPPEGKERITEAELKIIELWIDKDLKEDTKLDSIEIEEDLKEDILYRLSAKEVIQNPVFEKKVSHAATDKIDELRAQGFNVLPVAQDSPFLQVAYFDRMNPLTLKSKKALLSISDQLVWLDLSGAKNEDNNWEFLNSLKNLTKVYLSNTSVDDAVVQSLNTSNYLEIVGLFDTKITAQVLPSLIKKEHIKSLYLGNSAVQPQDTVGLFSQFNSDLKIHF